jgi:hypothetical protein
MCSASSFSISVSVRHRQTVRKQFIQIDSIIPLARTRYAKDLTEGWSRIRGLYAKPQVLAVTGVTLAVQLAWDTNAMPVEVAKKCFSGQEHNLTAGALRLSV